MTFAVWGAFQPRSLSRQVAMSRAAPPEEFAPRISGELGEAAAYDRLGVSLAW